MLNSQNSFIELKDIPDILLDIVEPKVRIKFKNSNWIGCENYSYSTPIQEMFPRLLEILRASFRGIASLSVLVGLPVWLPNLDILNFCGSGFLVGSCLSELRQEIAPSLEQTLFNLSQDFDFCLISIHPREFFMLEHIGNKWLIVHRGYIFLANKRKNVCWFGIGCDTETFMKCLCENKHYFFDPYLLNSTADNYSTDSQGISIQGSKIQRNLKNAKNWSSQFASNINTINHQSQDISVMLSNFFVFDPEELHESIIKILFHDHAQRVKI